MYLLGNGVVKNPAKAVSFTQAANKGDITAQTKLGLMYVRGIIVKQDITKGMSLLRSSALKGDKDALYLIEKYNKENVVK